VPIAAATPVASTIVLEESGLLYALDRFISFFTYVSIRGWAYDSQAGLAGVCIRQGEQRYGEAVLNLPSPDIRLRPNLRFELTTLVPGLDWSLAVVELRFTDGTRHDLTVEAVEARRQELHRAQEVEFGGDMAFPTGGDVSFGAFLQLLAKDPDGLLLEIGSRARSGFVRRELFPYMRYLGIDILAGENVDIVCDAHEMASHIPHGSIDAVFCTSTFEHILMPWKVAIEMNKIMRIGAAGYIRTHQSIGMHDLPWDYWRFSDTAWPAIFNRRTGFEIVRTYLGEPMFVVPFDMAPKWIGNEQSAGFAASAVTVRKIAETDLTWDVASGDLERTSYPA
jgi:hypothetical protein